MNKFLLFWITVLLLFIGIGVILIVAFNASPENASWYSSGGAVMVASLWIAALIFDHIENENKS